MVGTMAWDELLPQVQGAGHESMSESCSVEPKPRGCTGPVGTSGPRTGKEVGPSCT